MLTGTPKTPAEDRPEVGAVRRAPLTPAQRMRREAEARLIRVEAAATVATNDALRRALLAERAALARNN